MGPPGLVAPNLLSQPWLCSAPAFPVAEGWGDWESRRSEECRVSPPALSLLSLASHPSLERMSQGVGAMARCRHGSIAALHAKLSPASRAGTAAWGDTPGSHPAGSTATLCRWQELLDSWTIYLIPRKGTVGQMDLSDFDIPVETLRKG